MEDIKETNKKLAEELKSESFEDYKSATKWIDENTDRIVNEILVRLKERHIFSRLVHLRFVEKVKEGIELQLFYPSKRINAPINPDYVYSLIFGIKYKIEGLGLNVKETTDCDGTKNIVVSVKV